MQYHILREEGTERPFSSPLLKEHRKGTFACAGCDLPLFASDTKYDSGTGWPSFWQPLPNAVGERKDSTLGMARTEVHCRRCGGHLGHVFDDGPKPTGLRYCMDGYALTFKPSTVEPELTRQARPTRPNAGAAGTHALSVRLSTEVSGAEKPAPWIDKPSPSPHQAAQH